MDLCLKSEDDKPVVCLARTKIWYAEVNQSKSKILLQLGRVKLGQALQSLKCHLAIFRECPALNELRESLFSMRLIEPLYPLMWSTAQLSRFLDEPSIVELTAAPVVEHTNV